MGRCPGAGVHRDVPLRWRRPTGIGWNLLSLNRFGNGEQHDAVVDGVQAVAGGRDDEVITGAAVQLASGLVSRIRPCNTCSVASPGLSRSSRLVPAVRAIRVCRSVCW